MTKEELKKEKEKKKEQILEYLKRFPFYKWAAKSVGITRDTLEDWRKEDALYSARVEIARAEGINYFGGKATPDLILKSADPETFKDRLDVTSGNKPLSINLINYGDKPSVPLSTEAVSTTATPSTG